MDPEKAYWAEPWEDNTIGNFFIAVLAFVMVILVAVFLWRCCSDDECDNKPRQLVSGQNYPVTPIYAHELEPGIVVLQSQDGEFFRILQEYDARKRNGESSPPAGACSTTPAEIDASSTQYIPHYTRPHYQNHPSAPPVAPETLIDLDIPATHPVPPPYSKY